MNLERRCHRCGTVLVPPYLKIEGLFMNDFWCIPCAWNSPVLGIGYNITHITKEVENESGK